MITNNLNIRDKNKKLIESLDIEHEKFLNKLKEINFYKSMIRSAKNEKINQFIKQKEKSDSLKIDDEFFQMSNLVYKDIRGDLKSLGFIEKNIDELIELIEYQHNKQYQWFLVDIFELYIKFVENSYQIIEQNYPDLFIFSKKEKKAYYNIISKLKEKDSVFEKIENGSFFQRDMNYYLYMQMIKELRDAIVHQQGDKTSIEIIYTEMKKHLKGTLSEEFKEIIAVYFGVNKFQNMICINEISTSKNRSSDRLGFLIGVIVVYAELILNGFQRVIYKIEEEK
jgi:hypothetical protein